MTMFREQRIRSLAHIYSESLDPPLASDATLADELRALEDQQLFLEHHDAARPHLEPSLGRLSPADVAVLASMRAKFPSRQDRDDAAPYDRSV
jgi:hypothetical protein